MEREPEESPSPVTPTIVLIILGIMMTIPSMLTYDPKVYWRSTITGVQTHIVVGALLIPVCLALAVQTLGIPQINPIEPSTPPLVDSIAQNTATAVIVVMIIFFLLMVNPLRAVAHGPWHPPPRLVSKRWW